MTYKPGDEIAVRMVVTATIDSAHKTLLAHFPNDVLDHGLRHEYIIGPAPKRPVDWSAVPWGTRVRVRGNPDHAWTEAVFVCPKGSGVKALAEGWNAVSWWPECELLEGEHA